MCEHVDYKKKDWWVHYEMTLVLFRFYRRLNKNSLTGTVPMEVLSLVLVGNLTELCVILFI